MADVLYFLSNGRHVANGQANKGPKTKWRPEISNKLITGMNFLRNERMLDIYFHILFSEGQTTRLCSAISY